MFELLTESIWLGLAGTTLGSLATGLVIHRSRVLNRPVRTLRHRVTEARRTLHDCTEGIKGRCDQRIGRYARWARHQHLAGQPLDVLKAHGGTGAQWAALESAGIRNLAGLLPRVPSLHTLPGVGPKTQLRLQHALRDYLDGLEVDVRPWQDSERHADALDAMAQLDELREMWSGAVRNLGRKLADLDQQLTRVRIGLTRRGAEEAALAELSTLAAERLEQVDGLLRSLRLLETRQFQLDADAERDTLARISARTAIPLTLEPPVVVGVSRPGPEQEFEDTVLVPLLRHGGLTLERQVSLQIQHGSSKRTGFADIVVVHEGAVRSVIESKFRIRTSREAGSARAQARSYALALRVRRIAVASTEGIRIFDADFEGDTELAWIPRTEFELRIDEIVALLSGRDPTIPRHGD